jgi:REP element-mobilizing transposase RayT
MIHGYHVIFGAYGFWLPNDPRGSWSEFVGSWELVRFGKTTRSIERSKLAPYQERLRQQAKESLRYESVQFAGVQARAVGRGFAHAVRKSRFTVWACSILPEHVHLVLARHTYSVEKMVNLLKGEATKEMNAECIHPLAQHATAPAALPSPWARGRWKVYLDTEEAIDEAIRYVDENPMKEGKPKQTWPFVTPFGGLDKGWTTYR